MKNKYSIKSFTEFQSVGIRELHLFIGRPLRRINTKCLSPEGDTVDRQKTLEKRSPQRERLFLLDCRGTQQMKINWAAKR